MNYEETIEYLFNVAPLFQQIGGAAYKPGIHTTEILDEHFSHPHRKYLTIHVAGTNGKGSCAHTLAAWLQLAGYRVGLYTSPHLVDFRERIRVNGEMIDKQRVVDFVADERDFFESLHPSFFELTTALAFQYFAEQQVDIAVIEVGLGGRLDCTNIISPILSVITNISLDHTQFLGNTLKSLASEKAGVIKPHTPVVIGETVLDTKEVFIEVAKENEAKILFAEEDGEVLHVEKLSNGHLLYNTKSCGEIEGELSGECQRKNTNTLLCAMKQLLQILPAENHEALTKALPQAFKAVTQLTGLRGRWEQIESCPTVICDTGHNVGGWEYLAKQVADHTYAHTHIIFGMAGDKDIDEVLKLMPQDATYYFTKASVKRSLSEKELHQKAAQFNLKGETYPNVAEAFASAKQHADQQDLIFVGGSNFIVADFFQAIEQ